MTLSLQSSNDKKKENDGTASSRILRARNKVTDIRFAINLILVYFGCTAKNKGFQ